MRTSWRIGAIRGAFEGSPSAHCRPTAQLGRRRKISTHAPSLPQVFPCEHQTANTSMQAAQRTIGSHGTALNAASCSSSTSSSRAGFRRPFSGARLQQAGKRSSRLRAAELEELDEIDPMTGLVIGKTSVKNPVAGFTLQANGLTHAYRKSEPDSSNGSSDKPEVLLLHGIGSSSYSYRNTLALLGADGYTAYAPDWIGHGDSSKPSTGQFRYSERDYLDALHAFVQGCGIKQPFALVVQGYILGQYGLLYALEHPELVSRLLILNTPLSPKTKLRPELAAYKSPLPFMRPGNKPFDGMMFNMSGSPYAMMEADAMAYGRPYTEDPAGTSAAIAATMDAVDFAKLCSKVDDGFRSWRQPSLLLFGANDPFVPINTAFDFLDSKRTTMKIATATAKLGHMPQEDFAEAVHESMIPWLEGVSDNWEPGKVLKMTKRGVVDA